MITKCIFPVAGYGTRFLPATKSMPKEMLPILNRPLIEYGVEESLNSNMKDICMVTGRGKRAIEDYFDMNYELEVKLKGTLKEEKLDPIRRIMNNCTFSYIRQRNIHGLGDAVLTAEPIVGKQPFGVILADDLCVNELGVSAMMCEMVKIYQQYQCSVLAVMQVPDSDVHRYGIVSGKNITNSIMEINSIVEKPQAHEAPSNWAVVGRYIFTPDIFDILRNTTLGINGEVQLTDAISHQLISQKVIAYKFNGIRFDCGSIDGFVAATNYFHQKNKQKYADNKSSYNFCETS